MPIHFGIIGTSWITASFIHCAHATSKWNLGAVYSRKEETAKEFASKYSDRKMALYTSLGDLANDSTISTVYIASPNILHYEHTKTMLSAGKHVILEKPSCSTVAELDELFALAKAKGVILIEAFRHIQEANFKVVKEAIGKVGPLYGASITFCQYSSRYEKVLQGQVPSVFDLKMGGGALADLGVYCVSAAIDLFGPPLSCCYAPVRIATGADGAGTLVLQYASFHVHLHHSKMYNSASPMEIYGEKGTLVVPTVTDIESVVFWDAKTKQKTELAGKKEGKAGVDVESNLCAEAREFARCIEDKDTKAIGKYEVLSRDVLKVLEGARRDNGLLFPGES
ncbi:hypothetical protein ACEQ8H_006437 [Pleosporales sp. CAS-2024a]